MTARIAEDGSVEVTVRGHTITIDSRTEAGGQDRGPTPSETLVASLMACSLLTAKSYMDNVKIDPVGLGVGADVEMASGVPRRIAAVKCELDLPDGVPVNRKVAVLRATHACLIHNSLKSGVKVEVGLP